MRSFFTFAVLAVSFAEAQGGGKGSNGAKAGSIAGTGKYKPTSAVDPSLAKHTIYYPQNVPAGEKLPLITWGNSGCAGDGVGFGTFLSEIASHGYVIVVSGVGTSFSPSSTDKDMAATIDWAFKNPAAAKYNIDTERISTSGQSCGGLQAIHIGAQDSRVKLITVFNSGSLNAKDTSMVKQVKVPIGYFLGGPSDIAYKNGNEDYSSSLPPNIPALLATINTGHMGTYFDAYGGKYGKAAVAWFNWHFKDDAAAKALFLSPASSSLTKDGWTIKSRNFK